MSHCVDPAGVASASEAIPLKPSMPKTIPWKPGMSYRDAATGWEDLPEEVLFAPIKLGIRSVAVKLDKSLEAMIRGKKYHIIEVDKETNFVECEYIMLCSSDPNISARLKSIDTYIKIRITKVDILKHSNGNVYIKSIYMELPSDLSFINSGPYSAIYNKKHQKLMNESTEIIEKTIHIFPSIPNFTVDATLGGITNEFNKNIFYPQDTVNKGIYIHHIL
jgi:hypothetical protein